MSEATVASILEQVRASGGRVTTTKRALVTHLVGAGGHLTAENLIEQLRTSHPDVADSTVYRILADLEERGLIRPVHTIHGPAVYHLAEGGEHHHHLICDHCGTITDIPPSVLGPLIQDLREAHGFVLDANRSALQGTCGACLTSSSN